MTKSDLIANLAAKCNSISEEQASQAITLILDTISQAVSTGKRVEIRGFGAFSLHYWGPRHARNPVTGESWRTEPLHFVHFKPGKALRERVNMAWQQSMVSQNFSEDAA